MEAASDIVYTPLSARRISYLLGRLIILLGATMLSSVVVGFVYQDMKSVIAFGAAGGATIVAGTTFWAWGRRSRKEAISRRDAIVVVGLSWVFIGMFGGLPYLLDGTFASFENAFFEAVSGFSTTGATVLTEIEGSLSMAGHFWRCLTHWLGGIGIVVLFVAIFPQLGVGGKLLFKSEVPGPIVEGLKPKIRETSWSLLYVYAGLTVIDFLLLWAAGMTWFDAICHAFSTLGTGGFSTKNASIGHWADTPAIDVITTVFMVVAGVNFALYYLAVFQRRPRAALADRELWMYVGITLGAMAFATLWLWIFNGPGDQDYSSIWDALRYGTFQVAAIVTTTGFGTDNFNEWAPVLKWMLVMLMFIGGCAGSTAGGMKVFRIFVLIKACFNEVYRAFRPESVRALRVGHSIIKPEVVHTIVVFFALYLCIWASVALFVAAHGYDLVTAATATVACLASIGPGLGEVNAAGNFAHFPAQVKIVLSMCMILGRLELFTVLVLLVPSFWRR